jgi:hypothetical protein
MTQYHITEMMKHHKIYKKLEVLILKDNNKLNKKNMRDNMKIIMITSCKTHLLIILKINRIII